MLEVEIKLCLCLRKSTKVKVKWLTLSHHGVGVDLPQQGSAESYRNSRKPDEICVARRRTHGDFRDWSWLRRGHLTTMA